MSNPTPGPWEISWEAPRWIIQAEHGPGKKALAFLIGDYVSCATDARLIAAAPELLEALKPFASFLDALENMGGATPRTGPVYAMESSVSGARVITAEDFKAARAAITKATGQ